jgi:hypothetical protein
MAINQINKYFSQNSKTKMTIEKLQKITTTKVELQYKVFWLKWWNCSTMARALLLFPVGEIKEIVFDSWLTMITFWAHVYSSLSIPY